MGLWGVAGESLVPAAVGPAGAAHRCKGADPSHVGWDNLGKGLEGTEVRIVRVQRNKMLDQLVEGLEEANFMKLLRLFLERMKSLFVP